MIIDDVWKVQPDNKSLYIYTDKIDHWEFDLDDENNPAYVINNDYLDYISTKHIVTTKYEIPTNDASLKYDEYKTKTIKARVVLPKTYELFSAVNTGGSIYMFIDSSVNDQSLFMVNGVNGCMFELGKTDYESYYIKAIITITGNLKIESGKGTLSSPYKIK